MNPSTLGSSIPSLAARNYCSLTASALTHMSHEGLHKADHMLLDAGEAAQEFEFE